MVHKKKMERVVIVDKLVWNGLAFIGVKNNKDLFDLNWTVDTLIKWGYFESAKWCQEHKADYVRGVINGFVVEGQDKVKYIS